MSHMRTPSLALLMLLAATLVTRVGAEPGGPKSELAAIYRENDRASSDVKPEPALAFIRKYMQPNFAYRPALGGPRTRAVLEKDVTDPRPMDVTITQTTTIRKFNEADGVVTVELSEEGLIKGMQDGKPTASRVIEERRDTWVKTADGWRARDWVVRRSVFGGVETRNPSQYQELLRAKDSQPGDTEALRSTRAALQGIYAEEDRAVMARRERPEAMRDFAKRYWTADYQATAMTGRVRGRDEAEKALSTAAPSTFQILKQSTRIEKVTGDKQRVVVLTRSAGEGEIVDEKGETGAAGAAYPFQASSYRRDTWVRNAGDWKLKSREQFGSINLPARGRR